MPHENYTMVRMQKTYDLLVSRQRVKIIFASVGATLGLLAVIWDTWIRPKRSVNDLMPK